MKKYLAVVIFFVSAAAHADSCTADRKFRTAIEQSYKHSIFSISRKMLEPYTSNYSYFYNPYDQAYYSYMNSANKDSYAAGMANTCSKMNSLCGGEVSFVDVSETCKSLRLMTGKEERTLADLTVVHIQERDQSERNFPR